MECIFCKIVNKELPSEIVYQDKEILGFSNIRPEAPVDLLFIPKRHIEWKDEFSQEDLSLLHKLISAAKKVALDKEIFKACKLIFNIGQTGHIAHIHLHLFGGWTNGVPKHNI